MRGRKSKRASVAPWREREGSKREPEEERVHSTVKQSKFQIREGGQAKRASFGVEA